MTLQEFKAWFEGFTAALPEGAVPNDAQWQVVKAKVTEIAPPGLVYRTPSVQDRQDVRDMIDDYEKRIRPRGWPMYPDKATLGVDLAEPGADKSVITAVEIEDDGFRTVEPGPLFLP